MLRSLAFLTSVLSTSKTGFRHLILGGGAREAGMGTGSQVLGALTSVFYSFFETGSDILCTFREHGYFVCLSQ